MPAKRGPKADRQRRARGSGYISETPDGRFKAHYPRPGARTGYYTKIHPDRPQAEAWLAELAEREQGKHPIDGGRQKFKIWCQAWLDSLDGLKVRSQATYTRKLGYTLPYIGERPIDDISVGEIDAMFTELKKDLADSSIRQIRGRLYACFDDAVRLEYIVRNPVMKPRKRQRIRPKRPAAALTTESAALLLAAARGHRLEGLFWIALTLGMRVGELAGLREIDVQLATGEIHIVQQYTMEGGRPIWQTPKSEASRRILPIPQVVVPLLRERLARLAVERQGEDWHEHGLFYPTDRGTPHTSSTLRRVIHRLYRRAGVPPTTLHNLRHTAALRLTNVGAPSNVKGAMLGHEPGDVTDGYGWPTVDTIRPYVDRAASDLWQAVDRAELPKQQRQPRKKRGRRSA